MRRSFIVFSLILLCALSTPAQTFRSTTEPAVRQVLERQQEAWNHHDLESFMAGYWNSPELTFFSGAKIYSGWQSTLERYRKTYQSEGREMGKLEFSDLKIDRGSRAGCGIGAWGVAFNHVRWKDAARMVHSGVPEISGRLENHSRPHVCRGVSR